VVGAGVDVAGLEAFDAFALSAREVSVTLEA
jgi:hypothetical protein